MRALELITDAGTGLLSHTKLWTHVAYAAATAAFVKHAIFSDQPTDVYLWLVYLGIVGAHNVSSKILSMKYGATNK